MEQEVSTPQDGPRAQTRVAPMPIEAAGEGAASMPIAASEGAAEMLEADPAGDPDEATPADTFEVLEEHESRDHPADGESTKLSAEEKFNMERNRVRRQAQVKGAVNRAGAGTDQMKLHEEGLMSAVAGGQIVNRLLHRAEIAQRDKDTETPSVGHRRGAVVGGGPSGFSPDQNLARPRLSLRELYSYERYRARKSMLKRRFETVGKGSVRARRQAVLPLMEKLLASTYVNFVITPIILFAGSASLTLILDNGGGWLLCALWSSASSSGEFRLLDSLAQCGGTKTVQVPVSRTLSLLDNEFLFAFFCGLGEVLMNMGTGEFAYGILGSEFEPLSWTFVMQILSISLGFMGLVQVPSRRRRRAAAASPSPCRRRAALAAPRSTLGVSPTRLLSRPRRATASARVRLRAGTSRLLARGDVFGRGRARNRGRHVPVHVQSYWLQPKFE